MTDKEIMILTSCIRIVCCNDNFTTTEIPFSFIKELYEKNGYVCFSDMEGKGLVKLT